MSDGQTSLNECLEGAMEAERRGVVVDWKGMCFKTYNVASNYVALLEKQLEELKADSTADS